MSRHPETDSPSNAARRVCRATKRLVACSLILLAGCASTPVGRGDLLDFLTVGVSTREDVILKLGEPNSTYEDARILAYRLSRDEGGWIILDQPHAWRSVRINLVVVFNDKGVLTRHSLVEVRSP